jgi:hypothetical protein
MSAFDTFETSAYVRRLVGIGGKADVTPTSAEDRV